MVEHATVGRDRTLPDQAGADSSPDAGQHLPGPSAMAVPGLIDGLAPLRRRAYADTLGGTDVAGAVIDELRRRRGGGDALPDALAGPMTDHFDTDLSDVRVHADSGAGVLARSMDAAAFTHSNDIYFAPGVYRPGSPDGQRVLAHELSHVAAQRSGADRGRPGPLSVGRAADPAEVAADRSADRAMAALRRTPAAGSAGTGPALAVTTDPSSAGEIGPLGEIAPLGEIRRWRWPWKSKSKSKPKAPSVVPITPTTEGTKDGTGPTETTKDGTAPGEGAKATAPEVNYPRVATIGTEQVQVASKAEEDEADKIVKELKDVYEIDLSSTTTMAALKKSYSSVPKSVTDKLTVAVWTIRELRALVEAATFYAPILGAKRQESTKKGSLQGVTTIGKLRNAINKDTKGGKLDTTTLGEYFDDGKSIGLFGAGTNAKDKNFVRPGQKKTDVQTSLTATAIHEMAHALVQPRELTGWISTLDFWTDKNTKSGKRNAEKPPTSYGKTNAAEDLCESVALYFINREELKRKCPERDKFIDKVVTGWTPKTATVVVDTATASPGSETPPPTTED